MLDTLRPGQTVIAFDKFDWIFAGRPEDSERFWKEARVERVNVAHHSVPETVTLTWNHGGPRNTSHGHRPEDLKLVRVSTSK